MWYQNIWTKKIGLFFTLAVLYALLPNNIQEVVGCFAVGWMFVDISDKIFN